MIEDAAQFYSKNNNLWQQNSSKIKLISFGYTKLMDLGEGGVVSSSDKNLIQEIKTYQKSYKFQNRATLSQLSKSFKFYFYSEKAKLYGGYDIRSALKDLGEIYNHLLDVELRPTQNFWERLSKEFNKIDVNVDIRRTNYLLYSKYFKDTNLIPITSYDGIPWRASFRIEGLSFNQQDNISSFLREKGFDVSNWYLPGHWLTGVTEDLEDLLPATIKLSKEIIQFWVNKNFKNSHFEKLAKLLAAQQGLK